MAATPFEVALPLIASLPVKDHEIDCRNKNAGRIKNERVHYFRIFSRAVKVKRNPIRTARL
jgi:hypothetical protein